MREYSCVYIYVYVCMHMHVHVFMYVCGKLVGTSIGLYTRIPIVQDAGSQEQCRRVIAAARDSCRSETSHARAALQPQGSKYPTNPFLLIKKPPPK